MAQGSYQASFKAVLLLTQGSPDAPASPLCALIDFNTIGERRTRVYTADATTYTGSNAAAMSGAEAIRITAHAAPAMICVADSSFRLYDAVTASFTRLNSRTVETVEPETLRTRTLRIR